MSEQTLRARGVSTCAPHRAMLARKWIAIVAIAGLFAGVTIMRVLDRVAMPADASMTYMFPGWKPLSVPGDPLHGQYRAYTYEDSRRVPPCAGGVLPLVYVPGNAGSYRQARSLGGELAQASIVGGWEGATASDCVSMPIVAVDLNEEFSAFDAR